MKDGFEFISCKGVTIGITLQRLLITSYGVRSVPWKSEDGKLIRCD